ncbi:Uma2 family endonuclease [Actinoplanes sp. NPDC051633]|uniref:Uma2 family endonuclease n=1 Tax=Actinoplanes sp. NPDC051633 TaxID=3155670 RepID=UPI00341BE4EC
MAAPAREPSFELLGTRAQPWTAQSALDLLPETSWPRVEVIGGSVVVTPHAGVDHQEVELELGYRMKAAARSVGLWVYSEINIVSGDDLFIPDIVVLRRPGGGRKSMPISDAVLLGEIVSRGSRRKDLVDRPRGYAEAGVPWYLRVDFVDRRPVLVLHRLVDGSYQPVPSGGSIFTMTEPFAFSVDPADLVGPEA